MTIPPKRTKPLSEWTAAEHVALAELYLDRADQLDGYLKVHTVASHTRRAQVHLALAWWKAQARDAP